MAHPGIRWYCGECGWPRGDEHTCPPENGEVIASLVDALPRNTPRPAVTEEIERVSALLRDHRPDALEVDASALSWLLSAWSYLENATEKLASHRAVIAAAQTPKAPPAPAVAPAPEVSPAADATRCLFCGGTGGGHCAECYR